MTGEARTAGTLGTADIGRRIRITGPLAWGDDATEGELSTIVHKPGPFGPLTQMYLTDATKACVPGNRPVEILPEVPQPTTPAEEHRPEGE